MKDYDDEDDEVEMSWTCYALTHSIIRSRKID